MTSYRMDSKNLEKWIAQNKAEYTGDFVDGALLDNFMLSCKRGYAAVYEHYLNCWESDYIIEFGLGSARDVWRKWFEFYDRNELAV
ncbi:MAG: hypothetical protein RR313_11850 [Anaerovoracaceae bacterium]